MLEGEVAPLRVRAFAMRDGVERLPVRLDALDAHPRQAHGSSRARWRPAGPATRFVPGERRLRRRAVRGPGGELRLPRLAHGGERRGVVGGDHAFALQRRAKDPGARCAHAHAGCAGTPRAAGAGSAGRRHRRRARRRGAVHASAGCARPITPAERRDFPSERHGDRAVRRFAVDEVDALQHDAQPAGCRGAAVVDTAGKPARPRQLAIRPR